jgi:hypothetical protein
MLAGLAVLGMLVIRLDRGDQEFGSALYILPPLVSVFVAPWLTMATRSPLAGAVFTFGALGGSLAAGEWIGELRYGFTNQVDAFRVAFMWWAMGGLSVLGAVMGWRTFATLEAIDGQGADLQLPFARRRAGVAPVTRRHPLVRLVAKELRLQQLAIVVSAMWALAYTVTEASGAQRVMSSHTPDIAVNLLSVSSAFYSVVLPLVIGSLACAEERHFGTLDAQLLLPVRSSTQWIVKSAAALGLAVALALLLPLALARMFGDVVLIAGPGPRSRLTTESVIFVLGMTSISLYVSTLARSGIRALIGSVGIISAFGFVVGELSNWSVGRKVFVAVHAARAAHTHPRYMVLNDAYRIVPLGAFVVLVVALALPNYRYAARRPALVAMHAAIVLACVLAYDVVMSVIMALKF